MNRRSFLTMLGIGVINLKPKSKCVNILNDDGRWNTCARKNVLEREKYRIIGWTSTANIAGSSQV